MGNVLASPGNVTGSNVWWPIEFLVVTFFLGAIPFEQLDI
jgi:hypothetical protein